MSQQGLGCSFEKQWSQHFECVKTPVVFLEAVNQVEIWVKRDDLNHPHVQGNKLRKLKYGTRKAVSEKKSSLITFGGAYSNHLLAAAAVAKAFKMRSVGFVRGEELVDKNKWSSTLVQAANYGMELHFLSRKDYKNKHNAEQVINFLESQKSYWLIPEGGSELSSTKGLMELVQEVVTDTAIDKKSKKNQQKKAWDKVWDYIFCPCGTGGTLAGIIEGVAKLDLKTKVIGVPVLFAATQIRGTVEKLAKGQKLVEWELVQGYEAGGYAKMSQSMLEFGQKFTEKHDVKLDKIYNIKSFYAVYDLIKKNQIKAGSRVLLIHTGGLQGGWV